MLNQELYWLYSPEAMKLRARGKAVVMVSRLSNELRRDGEMEMLMKDSISVTCGYSAFILCEHLKG